ncbi:DUF58 domain-containing protein [Galactobacter caseinivorans]|uniref:DUF58 domain-containing protein n=1 Tax=Galactobacter caseinivorans TaxID=2676123 RepID=UPI001314DFFD|nr:DUF58 domain-containing protein [Galactobacter caseinivorans]
MRVPRPTLRAVLLVLLGAALLAAASFLGRPELAAFGGLLIALPLAAWLLGWWWVRPRGPQQVRVQRRLNETPEVGGQSLVRLTVEGHDPGPGRELLRGFQPQHATSRGDEPVTYLARFPLRGGYRLGPFLSIRTDPLGLVLRTQPQDPGHELTVALPPSTQVSDGDWEELLPSRTQKGSEADTLTRPYQEGDPYRRIHWPVSARQGRMMVRPDAEDHDGVPAVMLDRQSAHYGGAPTWVHEPGGGRTASTASYDAALRTAAAAATVLRKGTPGADIAAFPAWTQGRLDTLLASSVPSPSTAQPTLGAGLGSLVIITGIPGDAAATWPGRHSRRRVTVLMHGPDDAAPPSAVLAAWERAGWTWRTLSAHTLAGAS